MKRIISLILIVLFIPLAARGEISIPASEVFPEILNSSEKPVDSEPLRDGNDETGIKFKSSKADELILILPEDYSCATLWMNITALPDTAELLVQNEKKKWEPVLTVEDPGLQFSVSTADLSGRVKLRLSFAKATVCEILELRCFSAGTLPEYAHTWKRTETADILLVAETFESLDTGLISSFRDKGYSVAVAAYTSQCSLTETYNRLWSEGLRIRPLTDTSGKKKPDYKSMLAGWVRAYKPLMVITDAFFSEYSGEGVSLTCDPSWNTEDAEKNGLWAVHECLSTDDDPLIAADQMTGRGDDRLREWCVEQFASAQHADPSTIPYPATRLDDGYLPEGEEEFVYEDPENGLWAYLSSSLQVEIIRYVQTGVPQRWFEAFVTYKPEIESFTQHTYINATFKGQQIYPETLAQTSKLVFAVNGDYHPNRASQKMPVGNIIRRGEVLYNYEKGTLKFPNLDTLAIHKDGSFSVYARDEMTADDLLALGDVTDSLSFGPYLVRNGEMRVYNGNCVDVPEPRCAYGMISPGKLFFVMVEGKMPDKGEQGLDLWQMSELMYARGCSEAMNVDGGSTAVMLFMGRKLNRTGKGSSLGSPRNQHELFGIGSSEQVHTDMADGKKK